MKASRGAGLAGRKPRCAGLRRGSRGAGLVVASIMLTVLGLASVGTVAVLRTLKRDSLHQGRLLEARAVAEAGLEDALVSLSKNPDWRSGFSQKAFAGGTYSVALSTDAHPTVTSTGYARALHLLGRPFGTVQARVHLARVPGMPFGVQANRDLSLGGVNYIDGFDSDVNPAPVVFSWTGSVWTNARVSFTPIAVFGSATYFSGDPPGPGTVTGAVARSTFTLAAAPAAGGAFAQVNDNLTGLTPASLYEASSGRLLVPAGSSGTIRTGIYFFSEIDLDGALTVDASQGPVLVYVNGQAQFDGTLNNESKVPSNFVLYGLQAAIVRIGNPNADFRGVLHAPLASVSLNTSLYGAILADSVAFGAKGIVHYDVALGRRQFAAVRLLTGTWSEPADSL